MRTPLRRLSPVLIAAAACAGPQDQPTAPSVDLALGPGQAPIYMVTFRPEVADVDGLTLELAGRHGFAVAAIRRHAARGFTAAMPDARADQIRNDPRVLIVERDGPVSLITPIIERGKPGGGDGGSGGGEETPWGITRVGGSQTYTGSNRAWVLDTGIDQDHPDLNVDQTCTVSFAGGNGDDKNGHGTHVAGTIGAIDNTIGVVGVAAGVKVCSVQVLGASGSGSWSGVVAGVNHVAANGASGDVANMSLGGPGSNATLEQAIRDAGQAGIRFALAAGNESTDAGTRTPARTNGTNVYTISAIGSNDCLASFSNYGDPVDFAAPGVGVKSTVKGGGYKTYSGTSMAAPHVAGLLLFGTVNSNGAACKDPDGNPDPIAHR